jgi:hypothetical protein
VDIIASIRADWQRHRDRLLAEGGDWWATSFDDGQNRPPKKETPRGYLPRGASVSTLKIGD